MIYDILPEKDLHYSDIRDTLAANGGTVNNDVSSAFKEAANINMWSKHKPVRYNSPFTDLSGEWWKAIDGDCGLVPFGISNYLNLPDYYENYWASDDMNGWIYALPKGGELEPFRLGDFRGYNTYAAAPYRELTVPSRVSLTQTKFDVSCMLSPMIIDSNIKFTDLRTTKDCYFGVYIKKDGSSLGQRATSAGIDDTIITFKTSGFSLGKYTVYPFFSTEQIGQSDTDKAAIYYSIPLLSPVSFEVIDSFIRFTIIAKAESSFGNRVTYEVYVNNSSSSAIRLTNNYVWLRFADKDFLDPMVAGEKRIKVDDVSAPAGRMLIAEGAFEGVDGDLFENCKVWVSYNSSQYIGFAVPLKPTTPIL